MRVCVFREGGGGGAIFWGMSVFPINRRVVSCFRVTFSEVKRA